MGKLLRVGYYSKQDGLNCIWIVHPDGNYAEATNHRHFNRFFEVATASDEVMLYGEERPVLGSLPDEKKLSFGTDDGFVGLLAGKTKKVATIEEINEAASRGWAGAR